MRGKKKKLPDTLPCKNCKHPSKVHVRPFPPIWESFCSVDLAASTSDDYFYKYRYCNCSKFQPDNLEYLLGKYKEKERGKKK